MNNNSTAKVITILDYIGILCILGFFIEKDNPDVRFHTNQGLTLLLLDVAIGVLGIVGTILAFIPVVGWIISLILGLVSGLLGIAVFVLMIIGIINAAQGQQKPLPVIGGLFKFVK